VGAPSYFADRPLPQTPQDLRDHACINYRWSATGALYRWHFENPDRSPLDVDVSGPLTLNDTGIIIEAALEGSGLACLPESSVMDQIASGRLVRTLDEWCRPFSGFFLYYPSRRHMPVSLRTFIDFVRLKETAL